MYPNPLLYLYICIILGDTRYVCFLAHWLGLEIRYRSRYIDFEIFKSNFLRIPIRYSIYVCIILFSILKIYIYSNSLSLSLLHVLYRQLSCLRVQTTHMTTILTLVLAFSVVSLPVSTSTYYICHIDLIRTPMVCAHSMFTIYLHARARTTYTKNDLIECA